MLLHRIIRLVLQCVLLCIVNLSNCDLPKENLEAGSINQSHTNPSQTMQPGDIDCEDLRRRKSGDDDNGETVSIPPDVCGLCPAGEHDLEPCECISMGHQWAGLISITCNSSTHWTTVDEMKEMFNSVDEDDYLTTHVFRFSMTGTNVSGTIEENIWGPLDFHQIIMDNNKIQIVDNHAFTQSKDTLSVLSFKNNEIFYFHWDQIKELPLLYQLTLRGNNLTFIPSEIFPTSDIEYLDVSWNMIDYIGHNAFDNLRKLRKLNLSHNELQSLDDNSLSIINHNPDHYNNLQIILSNNYISYISLDAFANVHPVFLDLSNNLLTTVDELAFIPLILGNDHFLYVVLTGNPILCDCELGWMANPNYRPIFSDFECYDENGDPMGYHFSDLEDDLFEECFDTTEYY